MKKILSMAGAALLASSVMASASTLSLVGGSSTTLGANFNPVSQGTSNLTGVAAGDQATVFGAATDGGLIGGGLWLSAAGKSKVTITYLGKDASALNYVVETADATDDKILGKNSNYLKQISFTQMGSGFVDFLFRTTGSLANPTVNPFGEVINGGTATRTWLNLGFTHLAKNGRSIIALFDDGSSKASRDDNDYDDMVVRIDVQAVPLPAGGFLLLGGLGGLFAARRRKV